MKEFYESPLSSRYASEYMLRLFSPDKRYGTWRRLWVALARAEHRLGLPVTDEQVAQLEAHVDDEIDYAAVAEWEKSFATTSWRISMFTAKAAPMPPELSTSAQRAAMLRIMRIS